VITLPFAHVGGMPIEETLGSFGPALLVALGVTWTKLRARLRMVRSRAGGARFPHKRGARRAGGPVGPRGAVRRRTRTLGRLDEQPELAGARRRLDP